MRRSIFLLFSIVLLGGPTSFAQGNEGKIDFQVYSYSKNGQKEAVPPSAYKSGMSLYSSKTKEGVNIAIQSIDLSVISSFVSNLRKTICGAIKFGSVRTWVTVGGKAGTLVVSAEANVGMEIIINCNQTNEKTSVED